MEKQKNITNNFTDIESSMKETINIFKTVNTINHKLIIILVADSFYYTYDIMIYHYI